MSRFEENLADAEFEEQFEDEREETLIRLAAQGEDVIEFLHGNVGRYVIGAAAQERKDIELKLCTIRPNTRLRRRKIEELQKEHDAIGRAIEWLTECVRLGKFAQQSLEEPQI